MRASTFHFGVGLHNCFGAPLARLEARIVLEEVSRRLPSLQLSENAKLNFPASISMRGQSRSGRLVRVDDRLEAP